MSYIFFLNLKIRQEALPTSLSANDDIMFFQAICDATVLADVALGSSYCLNPLLESERQGLECDVQAGQTPCTEASAVTTTEDSG